MNDTPVVCGYVYGRINGLSCLRRATLASERRSSDAMPLPHPRWFGRPLREATPSRRPAPSHDALRNHHRRMGDTESALASAPPLQAHPPTHRYRVNDALRRLLRPAPPPTIDAYFRERRDSPCCAWIPGRRTSVASCGHDLSLEHAVTPEGACRACANEAILRKRGAA